MTVTLKASQAAQPAPEASYDGPPSLRDQLAQLLPGGHGGAHAPEAPHVFIGMLGLLLVAAFPFVRAVPLKARIGWCGLAAGVAASFVWRPTILLWHGFALPNGSPYRAAFVLSAIFTMIAWLALAHRPRTGELAAGAVLVAVLAWCCRGQSSVGTTTWILVLGGGAVSLLALVALRRCRTRSGTRTGVRTAVTAALICTVLLGSALAALSVTAERDTIAWFRPKTTLSGPALAARKELAARADWPRSRTDPGPHEFANNDPLLLGGEGGSYYSSYLPASTARTLHGLGAGWYVKGRHTLSVEDPVGRAIMGVSSSLVPVAGHGDRYALRPSDAAPLLTVRSKLPRAGGGTVFARQERVLGARVYEVPSLTPTAGAAPLPGRDGWTLPAERHPATGHASAGTTFTARCTPGSTALWYAPWFSGRISGPAGSTWGVGQRDMTANPVRVLGTVPADGTVSVRFTSQERQHLPVHPLGCLSPRKLAAAVAALRAKGPVELTTSGHGLTAELPAGSSGSALLAVPAVAGWSCSVDGGPARAPRSFGGLLTVPLGTGATRLACSYAPPGLPAGLAVSCAAALTVAAVAGLAAVRGRRKRSSQRIYEIATKQHIYRMALQRTAPEPSPVPGEKACE
ncbi:YfhO family protein [Streptomyces sp. NPDC050636]|uniref:YfhO family protein n=1 Tax=Streptomyces sp. NPDC050636 TaxID=3154510 RepID=UPI0034215BB5